MLRIRLYAGFLPSANTRKLTIMSHIPPIYFYIPQSDWTEDMPENADTYWVGFRRGIYCWTLQTYLHLKASGFPCELVGSLPNEGIVVSHWDSLPEDFQPGPKLLVVCIQADRARHPYAQVHIVQNPKGLLTKLMLLGDKYLLPGGRYYMPLWSQPELIPRNSARGDRFENIAFFGLKENLLPELQSPSWQEQLEALGLRWQVVSRFESWNDYSDVDAILAVRSFGHQDYIWKPATKLYNSWHAGVPAILGSESAYQAERKSELDYIEVTSLSKVISALKRLRDDKSLRQAMIENGQIRAQETQPERIVARWRTLLIDQIIPEYEAWISSRFYRQSFIQRRQLALATRGMRKDLQQIRNSIGVRTRLQALLSSVKPQAATLKTKSNQNEVEVVLSNQNLEELSRCSERV